MLSKLKKTRITPNLELLMLEKLSAPAQSLSIKQGTRLGKKGLPHQLRQLSPGQPVSKRREQRTAQWPHGIINGIEGPSVPQFSHPLGSFTRCCVKVSKSWD